MYYVISKYGAINKFATREQAEKYLSRIEASFRIFDHFPTEEEYCTECDRNLD
jgi:hypothetical protein